jgi:3alpha(or 20beta)-hydroxysteroid dehydrogenase
MGRLDGKVVMVTGGASGMGASHARRFVAEGAKVVITDVNEAAGMALAAELGDNCLFIRHDVTKWADWEKSVAETEAKFGPVTGLINNAGISMSGMIEETSEEVFRKVIEVNQLSVFLGMKAVVASMKKAGGGSIVNISSLAGLVGMMGSVAYCASKWAVRGMTKVAALEFAPYNIRVNSIHPGVINTPMVAAVDKDLIQALVSSYPIKRLAEPAEVTNLALYLISDESSFSTGSEFIVDGGASAQ